MRAVDKEAAVKRLQELGIDRTAKRFFLSIRNGDSHLVELFLDSGFSPDSRDKQKIPAAVVARRSGHFEIARLLLARGASAESLLRSDDKPDAKQKDGWDRLTAFSGVLSLISSGLIA